MSADYDETATPPPTRRSAWPVLLFVVPSAWAAWAWPTHEIAAWTPPELPIDAAPAAQALAGATILGDASVAEPEDVVVDESGVAYASCADGWIRSIAPDGTVRRVVYPAKEMIWFGNDIKPGYGRPLGLALARSATPDNDVLLYTAVADVGIVSIGRDHSARLVRRCYENSGTCFVDGIDQARDGTVYYTATSTVVGIRDDHRVDIASGVGTGKLFAVPPMQRGQEGIGAGFAGSHFEPLLTGLFFANGVAVDPDQQSVLIAETARYRISRHWVAGARRGQTDVLVANLPGMPDNLHISPRGTLWIGFVTPRIGYVDRYLHPSVALKYVFALLPSFMLPRPRRVGLVGEVERSGRLLRLLADGRGDRLANTTAAFEAGGKLYVGRLYNDAAGVGVVALQSE